MSRIIPKAVDLIDQALKQDKAVLVHCLEGKMRSATVLTAYIMQASALKLNSAKDFVRAKHCPAFDFGCSSHFEEALQKWGKV